jgi:hypothetical protein
MSEEKMGASMRAIELLAEYVREHREAIYGPNPYPPEVFEASPLDPEAVALAVTQVFEGQLPVVEQIHDEACRRGLEDLAKGITKHLDSTRRLRKDGEVDPGAVVAETMMLLRQISNLKRLREGLYERTRRIALELRDQGMQSADTCFDDKGNVVFLATLDTVLDMVKAPEKDPGLAELDLTDLKGPKIPWNIKSDKLYTIVANWWLKRIRAGAACHANVYITPAAASEGAGFRVLARLDLRQVPTFDDLIIHLMEKFPDGRQRSMRWTIKAEGPEVRAKDVGDIVTISPSAPIRSLASGEEGAANATLTPEQLPIHEAGLTLEHNPNRGNYETVEVWLKRLAAQESVPHFASAEAMQRAVDTNEVWVLRWYPHTPVGFEEVAAPTLPEVLEAAR